MERKSTSEETQGLSADDLCDHRLKKAYGGVGVGRLAVSLTLLGAGGDYFLEPSYSKRLGAVAPLPMSETIFNSCSPGAIHPGIFFGYCGLLPTSPDENSRRPLDQRGDISQFHESDLGDVYDLYNACNGLMLGGLLDVRKLDELSPEELEALDVERLREVWAHTAAGCVTCAGIIRTLNAARGILREERIGAPADGPER